jgi:hypothetical protein
VLALRRRWNRVSRGGVRFREVGLISDLIFDKGDIDVIAAGPCADIDRLKADSPDAAEKDDDTQSDEEEMRRG